MRVFVLPLLLTCTTAVAQPIGADITLQSLQPAADANGLLAINGPGVLPHGQFSLGLTTIWTRRPLELDGYRVDKLVTPTLSAAVGLQARFVSLQVGATLPFGIVSGTRTFDTMADDFGGQGIGDLGFHGKVVITGSAHLLRIAALGSVRLPTASARSSWLGEGTVSGFAGIAVQAGSMADRWRGLFNVGVFTRSGEERFVAGASSPIVSGARMPIAAGFAYGLSPGRVEVFSELHTQIPIAASDYQPNHWLAGFKVYLADRSHLAIGGGVSLNGAQLDHSNIRGFVSIVFEPRLGARPGSRDQLDDEPIATMLFQPPTPPPAAEKPPETDEERDDDLRRITRVGESKIVILEAIHFEFDSAIIRPDSYRVLDAVALSLADNEDILLVQVQGHTDSRGSARYNLDLSRRRAAAVRDYLVVAGVAPERLDSRGYGESEPLIRRDDEQAWAANRRVEFVIQRRQ